MNFKNLLVAVSVSILILAVTNPRELKAHEISEESKICLAQNIFFEARNQSRRGQIAVAWVTINRSKSPYFPDDICEVVKQAKLDENGIPIKNQCQFSWYCDGKSDKIPEHPIAQKAWEEALEISEYVLKNWAHGKSSPVDDATMYHADYVSPGWKKDYNKVIKIEDHIFYE
jgi:spore germination cell wall hydrolase CwlJ-like protein